MNRRRRRAAKGKARLVRSRSESGRDSSLASKFKLCQCQRRGGSAGRIPVLGGGGGGVRVCARARARVCVCGGGRSICHSVAPTCHRHSHLVSTPARAGPLPDPTGVRATVPEPDSDPKSRLAGQIRPPLKRNATPTGHWHLRSLKECQCASTGKGPLTPVAQGWPLLVYFSHLTAPASCVRSASPGPCARYLHGSDDRSFKFTCCHAGYFDL
jgi:hypothetical protein